MEISNNSRFTSRLAQFLIVNSDRYNLFWCGARVMPVDAARNTLVQLALDNNCDYILFCDSDMYPSVNALTDLLAWEKDIVSGLCFHKTPPFYPAVRKENEAGKLEMMTMDDIGSELMEVASCGMAFVLIKMDVFKKLKSPWFKCRGGLGCGEDIDFFLNCRKQGFSVFLDPETEVGHIGAISDRLLHEAFINNFGKHNKLRTRYGSGYKW